MEKMMEKTREEREALEGKREMDEGRGGKTEGKKKKKPLAAIQQF